MLKDLRIGNLYPCHQWQPWVPSGEAVPPLHGPPLWVTPGGENQGKQQPVAQLTLGHWHIMMMTASQNLMANFSFCLYRKGRSASAHHVSPNPWSLRFLAAPLPSLTGPSSAACARTVAAAPLTEPLPCPWSSSAPTAKSWRSRWCLSRPAHATTTAPVRTTSLSPCTTRKWSVTWREETTATRSSMQWLSTWTEQISISYLSTKYLFVFYGSLLSFYVFLRVCVCILYMGSGFICCMCIHLLWWMSEARGWGL